MEHLQLFSSGGRRLDNDYIGSYSVSIATRVIYFRAQETT